MQVAYAALGLAMVCSTFGCSSDSGTASGGPGPDAGSDASAAIDSGIDARADAALPTGPLELGIACTDAAAAVYETPASLPPLTLALRGTIVACTSDGSRSIADIQARLDAADVLGVTAVSSARRYRISYRTEREPGVAGLGSALVLLPDAPREGMLPAIVATHGTAGLSDTCAPSRFEDVDDALALPWAALGYAVIAPDYAGLGNEGVQGYGHQADTSHSVLDAARALRFALGTDARLSRQAIVAGHSQGGGAAQAAQAFAPSYLEPDFEVLRAVSFAGSLPSGNGVAAFALPAFPITGGDGVTRAVTALNLYATFAKVFGVDRAAEGLHPDVREHVTTAIESQCVFVLRTTLATPTASYAPPNTIGEMVDPGFRQEMVDCAQASNCTERAEAYVAFAQSNAIPLADSKAEILLIGGELDVQNPPNRQACTRDELEAAGIATHVCQYTGRTHFDLVPSSIAYAMAWALNPETACPMSTELPACSGTL